MFQFDAGIFCSKAPVRRLGIVVATRLPSRYRLSQCCHIRYAPIQALTRKYTEFAFGQVQTVSVPGCVDKNSSLSNNCRALSGGNALYSEAPLCVLRLSITSVIRLACAESSSINRLTPSAHCQALWLSAACTRRQLSNDE